MQPEPLISTDPAAAPQADTADVTIQSIKGFNHDLTCRDFQFAPGETYVHTGPVEACASGFHACDGDEHPFSVFSFYAPGGAAGKGPARYFEVTQGGEISREVGCSKIASARITIGVELTIGDLVRRAWEFVWSRVTRTGETTATGYQGGAQATGDQGGAQATGYQGGAQATGDQGGAQATGDQGGAQATGYQGGAQATGTRGGAQATGDQGGAQATGDQGGAQATGDQGGAQATGTRGGAQATGDQGGAQATGTRGGAQATGYQGGAQATGYQGGAQATGYQGGAQATGDQGGAQATGDQGGAQATGTRGVAVSIGRDGWVLGAVGNVLVAIERDEEGNILSYATGLVGQNGVEANVRYVAAAGKLVRA